MKLTQAQWNELLIFCVGEMLVGEGAEQPLEQVAYITQGRPKYVTYAALEAMLKYLKGQRANLNGPAPEDLHRQFEESFMDPDGLEEMGDNIIDNPPIPNVNTGGLQ